MLESVFTQSCKLGLFAGSLAFSLAASAALNTNENDFTSLRADAPEWQPIKPDLLIYEKAPYTGPYFAGKMLVPPQDKNKNETVFCGTFKLKKAPSFAYLQCMAEGGSVTAWLNGKKLASFASKIHPAGMRVQTLLHEGDNTLKLVCTSKCTGTAADLYVVYADNSVEKFSADDSFRIENSSSKVTLKEIERPLSEADVSSAYLPYMDIALAQKNFISGSVTPAVAQAGSKVQLRFEFDGPMPQKSFPAEVKLFDKNTKKFLWSDKVEFSTECVVRTKPGRWQLATEYELPMYFHSCDVMMTLKANEFFTYSGNTPTAEFSMQQLDTVPGFEKPPVSKVERIGNAPQFTLNGKPFFALWGGTSWKFRVDKRARHSDMPLQAISSTVDWPDHWWRGIDEYDLTTFDRMAERYRRENPDAYFIINLLIYPPGEWTQRYADEMCLQSDGKNARLGRTSYSIASKQARKDMIKAMTVAINHLENSPYANRIIAYKINSGDTTEWLAHRYAEGTSVDFSRPSKEGFKEFAAQRYPQLKDTSIPLPEERSALDNGEIIRDVKKHLKTTAYNQFYSEVNADFMIEMCREARKLVKNRKLIGTYYGYTFMVGSGSVSHLRAHFAMKKVLDSGAVDFLMSPQCYSNRNLGDSCGDMKPFASMAKHNIVPIIEDDTRTHSGKVLHQGYYYCQTITEAQTLAVFNRNMAIAICRNQPNLFYSLCAGYDVDFPAAAQMGKTLSTVGNFAIQKKFLRNAEVAVVASEESHSASPTLDHPHLKNPAQIQQLYMPDGSIMLNPQIRTAVWGETLDLNLTRLSRSGIPTDYLLAEDLADEPGDYKVYFFLNCYNYDEKFLKAVEKLRQRNCTLVWLYAPGYTYGLEGNTKNMKLLTGFELDKVTDTVKPLIQLNDGRKFASPIPPVKPMFAVNKNDSAQVLGRYENGDAAFAVKQTGQAQSIFFGSFRLDVPIIQAILQSAGVFVYSESSDPVEANSNLVTLHARFAGKKAIRLPRKTDVLDIINKKIIARNVDRFEFDSPLHATWFFYYGNDADELLKKL